MKRDYFYYSGFTTEQFAADEYFQQWVLLSTDEHEQFWSSYLNLYPAQVSNVFKARQVVKEIASGNDAISSLTEEEKKEMKDDIFRRLDIVVPTGEPLPGHTHKKYRWRILAAAAVFIIAFISGYLFLQNKTGADNSVIAYSTGEGEKKEIVLTDSSVVILNANSSLHYDADFLKGDNREVYLQGNAFFHVKKNKLHKQFTVHTANLSVTVLGTQFNVNARSAAGEVVLTSGKVKVTKKGTAGIEGHMLPGDRIRFDTVQQALIRSRVDTQLYSAWTEGKWNFQQTTLEDIMALVNEYYGLKPVFKTAGNRQLKISAVMPVTDPDMLIRIISKTLRIKIDRVNSQLIIQ